MTADDRPDGYPDARRLDLVEELSGVEVSDPYRWLEDAASPDAQDWLRAQDELFRSHGAQLPGIDHLAGRILELTGTGHIGVPAWRGDRQFFTRRLPGQEHAVLCTVDPDGPGGRRGAGAHRPGGARPDRQDHAGQLAAGQGRPAAGLSAVRGRQRGVRAARP